jgi:hypothetical protein
MMIFHIFYVKCLYYLMNKIMSLTAPESLDGQFVILKAPEWGTWVRLLSEPPSLKMSLHGYRVSSRVSLHDTRVSLLVEPPQLKCKPLWLLKEPPWLQRGPLQLQVKPLWLQGEPLQLQGWTSRMRLLFTRSASIAPGWAYMALRPVYTAPWQAYKAPGWSPNRWRYYTPTLMKKIDSYLVFNIFTGV